MRKNKRTAREPHNDLSRLKSGSQVRSVVGQGSSAWNRFRRRKQLDVPDLRYAKLDAKFFRGANLSQADLRHARCVSADLSKCNLDHVDFRYANLTWALIKDSDLSHGDLRQVTADEALIRDCNLERIDASESRFRDARFERVNLSGANLARANLQGSLFRSVNLAEACLRSADLRMARLIGCNLAGADLSGSKVYGISSWDLEISNTVQHDLAIDATGEGWLTLDNIEVAQFMHLLMRNSKIRDVIDTVTAKAVLLIGRFSPDRKKVLDLVRGALRDRNYLPIVFDFKPPISRDLTETLSTLAHLARFVIADITDARSVPQELQRIVPHLPSVPVQPIIAVGEQAYGLFEHFRPYPWVMAPIIYEETSPLTSGLVESMISGPEIYLTARRGAI